MRNKKVPLLRQTGATAKALIAIGADEQEVATVNNSLTVQPQDRLENLRQRLSDAITLLYTHGVITDKMRTHARRNL